MKFTGVIIAEGVVRSGTSTSGNEWQSQTFVIEEDAERNPMSVAFDVWNGKFEFTKGERCTVHLDCQANEGKDGRWFNGIRVWKKEGGNAPRATQPAPAAQPAAQPVPVAQSAPATAATGDDDLPF